MDHDHTISRRHFAGAALTAVGLVAGGGIARAAAPARTAGGPLGPFYPVMRPGDDDFDMTQIKGQTGRALGRVIEVTGRVLDSKGNPVSGAELELWQCNAAGRYAHPGDIATAPLDPNFQGFARLMTGASGEWRVRTIKPSGYDSPIGWRTPHIHFDIKGRQSRIITQMYFTEDYATNTKDALYNMLGEDAVTAMAAQQEADRYRWDIVLADK
ncbi:protocatechuate 3,4-dioxygenase [Porphyrobacter sp. LM 6]|uniref:protocatechuate 3,4-dioxygenase n=1 Tax=Porphyrobacter sp. LM 6 TaxID=1896196 RepID=UPI000847563E|nr:protocatechuate 3,4-dioxygenase [Porphyrobacter sp. LM 6]AOL95348.1 protocatechuate 3,4-dioxygenase beta subunit [Porphyrobacter sp. LM 6]